MADSPPIPFHFHAEGHAVSGQFTRPVPVVLETQASTSLPTIGGHARARVENFCLHHYISFAAGHSHVSGSWQNEKVATTHSIATVEHLKVLQVLTADRVVARLTSEHRHGDPEGHIIALGSTFDNLRISGYEVKVTLRHDLLLKNKKFSDLHKQVASEKKSRTMSRAVSGVALCSLVEKITTDLPGATVEGHSLTVPQFGKVFFAEIFAEEGTRTLTMMRLQLGSPDQGTVTVSESRTNGRPSPPIGP